MNHCTTFAREARLIESLLVPSMGYYGWSSKVDNHNAIKFQPTTLRNFPSSHQVVVENEKVESTPSGGCEDKLHDGA